jgi:hypothetical protein
MLNVRVTQEKDTNYQSQKYYEDEGYDPFEDSQYFESYTDVGLQGEMVCVRACACAYVYVCTCLCMSYGVYGVTVINVCIPT